VRGGGSWRLSFGEWVVRLICLPGSCVGGGMAANGGRSQVLQRSGAFPSSDKDPSGVGKKKCAPARP